MKKLIKSTALLLFSLCMIIGAIILIPGTKANAASIGKTLKTGKVYKYDLNKDGKKEKIKITKKNNKDSETTFKVYVDGKQVSSYRNYCWAAFTLVDLDKKDKYQEIMCVYTGESDCISKMQALRYASKKKVTRINLKSTDDIAVYRADITAIPGDGTVKMTADTPFRNNEYVGCFYVDITLTVIGNKMVPVTCDEYNYTEGSFSSQNKLSQDTLLYADRTDPSSCVGMAPDLTKIVIKKVSVAADFSYDLYVECANGMEGWMHIPPYDYNDIDFDGYDEPFDPTDEQAYSHGARSVYLYYVYEWG